MRELPLLAVTSGMLALPVAVPERVAEVTVELRPEEGLTEAEAVPTEVMVMLGMGLDMALDMELLMLMEEEAG